MGKQVGFCMLLEDERMFLQFLSRDQDTVLLDRRMPEPKLHVTTIGDALASLQQRQRWTEILLWNMAFPISEQDIRESHLQTYSEDLKAWVETGEIDYVVDKSRAPVIEYCPSFLRPNGSLASGRIWADMYRLEENNLVYKGKEFELWYDRIARWLRRSFRRVAEINLYFGPRALEWYRGGGQVIG